MKNPTPEPERQSVHQTMFKNEPLTPGFCEWCGTQCDPVSYCCSLRCEAQLRRLEAEQGRQLIRTLKTWRKFSGRSGTPGEGLFSKITKKMDAFLRTDRQRREQFNQQRIREAQENPKEETDV